MSAKNRDEHNRWRNKTVAFRMSPEEAKLLDNLEFIPLDIGADAWADRVVSAALNPNRALASAVVAAAGYDCKLTAARIEEIYSQQIALCL